MSQAKGDSKGHSPEQAERDYMIGFAMAAVLTVIPFVLVGTNALPKLELLLVIGFLGLTQVVVHVRYFLHIDFSAERREELILLLFSAALLAIMIAGMIWILFNMYYRMM